MTITQNNISPILSICIPTFNRARCLDNLLKNLQQIVSEHGSSIEICISNNHSTDGTAEVIKRWHSSLALRVTTQTKNIGSTRNFIAVSGMAMGKWIMLIGDDDELNIDNFRKLVTILRSSNCADWILVGVADNSGKEILIGDLVPYRYNAAEFRKTVIRTGLYRFGFIGMHVFPAVDQPVLASLANAEDTIAMRQHWPHIHLLLDHIQTGPVQVFSLPVVIQEPYGTGEFWSAGDWVRVCLRKLNTVARVRDNVRFHKWFFTLLLLRELYSKRNTKEIIIWKILEPVDFSRSIYLEFFKLYGLLGPLVFMASAHAIFIMILYFTPALVISKFMDIMGYQYIHKQYRIKKLQARLIQRMPASERLDS